MEMQLVRTLWGLQDDPSRYADALPLIAAQNIDWAAVACPVQLISEPEQFAHSLAHSNLSYVPQLFTFGQTPDEHLAMLDDALARASTSSALHAVGQLGQDRWPTAHAVDFLNRALEFADRHDVQLIVETHRSRILANPWTATEILDAIPDLELSVDLSHWVCVAESCDLPVELIDRVAERAVQVDARVGHEQGSQVPDPRSPTAAKHLATFEAWWERIWSRREAAGAPALAFAPEHGPPPYQPSDPTTGEPLADINQINEWLANRLSGLPRTPTSEQRPTS